jgi:hypothetical protein
MLSSVVPKMHANAIKERPRALIVGSFFVGLQLLVEALDRA